MHFAVVAVVLLALSAPSFADEECKKACKNQCALGLTLCTFTPADEICKAANTVCIGQCDQTCGCLGECLKNCPSPTYGKGLSAITGNVVGFGSTSVCRTTCKSSCGVKLVVSSTKQGFDMVVNFVKGLIGMSDSAAPAAPAQ